ncbi:MAG TPA: divalent metal cation transporter [Solirubrobacteraceae bacterium]|jgi:Mn2+/Fe2+ NRAMP family transporter|nr:divalent metal cation transporter [Solirubrobacteraceae bacterium]
MAAEAATSPGLALPPLTAEDVARSWDRSRVHHARGHSKRWRLLWLLVGPGILAMLGENDGPSMIAYAADGAQYGLGFFVPFIPLLFAMAYICQEMCMRVGAVTHRGYGELVLQRYGRVWGWFGAGDLTLTNLVTLVAELISIRVGLAYFHLSSGVAVALGLTLVLFTLSGGRYWRWERIVLGMALFNGLFLLAAILVKPHVGAVVRSFDFSPFPGGSFNTLLLLLASTIGATVTPWMIFFQQSASADKGMTPRDIKHGRYDTAVGAVLAAIFGVGALIAGAALRVGGHQVIAGIQGFAGAGFPAALGHVAGSAVGAVFALGLIEAGAVAILTISASTAYAAGECVGVSHSFNSSPRSAAVFYAANIGVALLAAVVILIPGAPLLSIALNANVLATVLLPVSLVFMVMLANDRGLMGSWVNKRSTNAIGITVIAFVGLCGAAYGIDSFLQTIHLIGS